MNRDTLSLEGVSFFCLERGGFLLDEILEEFVYVDRLLL